MATRSTIAIELTDGKVKQVYCHWDGYLSHNGKLLFEHYKNPNALQDLINLGDISHLAKSVGKQHPFSSFDCNMDINQYKELYGDMTTFYGRDRGEKNTDARTFNDFEMYRLSAEFEEYNYILRNDGQWYVRFGTGKFSKADEALLADCI